MVDATARQSLGKSPNTSPVPQSPEHAERRLSLLDQAISVVRGPRRSGTEKPTPRTAEPSPNLHTKSLGVATDEDGQNRTRKSSLFRSRFSASSKDAAVSSSTEASPRA